MSTTSVTVMVIFLKMGTIMFKVPLLTVARHTDKSILKDTVQLKIYQFHKNPSLHFKEHCTKIDEISFIFNTLLFFLKHSFWINPVLISILDSFIHNFFSFWLVMLSSLCSAFTPFFTRASKSLMRLNVLFFSFQHQNLIVLIMLLFSMKHPYLLTEKITPDVHSLMYNASV